MELTYAISSCWNARAGSARHYRLIHDLVVSNGGKVSLDIRNKNKLNQHILTEVNCNIGIVNYKRVIPLLPYTIKDDVVIKTHSGSTRFYDLISRLGWQSLYMCIVILVLLLYLLIILE